ncbi:MAG: bifunctional metallophosphatase/5'-nucleotidase [Balneolaceae bacterium]|nr:MAG: bifunctional metallophosphatase/5'-nucleotidase [Balneolaceae bacterium]
MIQLQNFKPALLILAAILMLSCSSTPVPDLQITVMTTTDVHGYLMAWDYNTDEPEPRYSLLKAATLVDSIRGSDQHTLLLDAGDWLQGNPFAEYFARTDTTGSRYPFLTVADAMQYDAIVLGNHEFNFGLEYLNQQIGMTESPVLGGNIYLHGTTDPAYKPYIMREFNGIKTAIIGLTTPGSAVWDRMHVEGILDFGDGVVAAERYVEEVREAGADVVIILAHSGLTGTTSYSIEGLGMENFGRAVAETIPGIDLLVLGHTHRVAEGEFVTGPDGKQVGVIQAGRWASHLGTAKLNIYRLDNGDIRVEAKPSIALAVEHVPQKKELADLISEQHEAVRAYITAPIARTPEVWSAREARREDTPVIDLIQHVQLRETGAMISSSAAFNTNLSFGPGEITRGDLASLYPYENTLFVLEITGAQLREYLEFTSGYYSGVQDGEPVVASGWPGYNFDMVAGAEYVMDIGRPAGERITTLTINGEDVQDTQLITLAVNSYRAQGGGGYSMLSQARVVREINRSVRSMIEEYLSEKGSIRHEDVFRENWKLQY